MKQSDISDNKSTVFEMILSPHTEPGGVAAVPSEVVPLADWHKDHYEGQLAVDVLETATELILVSTMAGARADQIEIYLHNDMATIRGVRELPVAGYGIAPLHQECFWGKFSRTIVLPAEVRGEFATAEYRSGVLTIRIPKRDVSTKIPITIVDE